MSTMTVRKKRCETCHYGVVQSLPPQTNVSDKKVKCLKRSPATDWNNNKGIFPIMSAYDWCGQYRTRKDEEHEEIELGVTDG